jgi:hypothetical protein
MSELHDDKYADHLTSEDRNVARVNALIDSVDDPELQAALRVVFAKRCSYRREQNSSTWGIRQTGVEDGSDCLTIGYVRW